MISPKTIRFIAYRATSPAKLSIFRGGPVRFSAYIDPVIDLTGCEFLRLEIRESSTDTNAPLAVSEITTGLTARDFDFDLSSAETNHDISSAWLVVSAYFPEGVGDSDDNLDPLYIAELTVVAHNSSLLSPDPPDTALLPTGVFKTISVAGQDDVVATSLTNTLTLVEGSNVTITTDATTDTITISSSGVGGGGSIDVTNVSAATHNETATSGEIILLVNTTANNVLINLPTAVGNTAKITIKRVSGGSNTLTVDAFLTQTIDDGLTAPLVSQYETITLISDNLNWFVI